MDSLNDHSSSGPNNWDERLSLINALVESGRREEAAEVLHAIEELPVDHYERLKAGKAYGLLDYATGARIFDGILSEDPTFAPAHLEKALACAALGNLETARSHYEVALSLETALANAHLASALANVAPETTATAPEPASAIGNPPLPKITSPPEPASNADTVTASLKELIARQQGDVKATEKKAKISAFAVGIVATLGICVLMLLVVTAVPLNSPPQIVAAIGPPVDDLNLESQLLSKPELVRTPAAPPAVAMPIDATIAANHSDLSLASFNSPDLSLGLANAGMNFGMSMSFGDSGAGMGGGMGFFGRGSGEGLKGTFYDLKQTRRQKPTEANVEALNVFNGILIRAAGKGFSASAFSDYYKAPTELSFTMLAIPTMGAEEGPSAFAVEKIVQPKGWAVHYKGTVKAPKPGKWRFVGRFDDALVVFIDGKVVLDASWIPGFKEEGVSGEFGGPALANGKSPLVGNWIDLSEPFRIDILVGERPGGQMGGALLVQHEEEKYKERDDGSLILPVFATAELSSEEKKRLKDFPYEFHRHPAIFPAASK